MLWLIAPALAGDLPLYARALAYVDGYYLHPEAVNREQMFEDAGRQAERAVDWLVVDVQGPVLALHDGAGTWQAEVRLDRPQALPDALARLEDAIRGGPHPLPPDLDLRVELLRGVAKSLDRHSVILADARLSRFDERLSGTITGVGLTCAVQDAALTVTGVFGGSPADRGGVHVGDRLIAIDGRSTVGMVAADVTGLLRGATGTTVTLRLARGDDGPVDITLQRAEVQVPNVFVDRASGDVGVVRIDHFSEQTHEWLYRSLDAIRQSPVAALVLDLRGNTGGSLLQSADAADAFLQHGRIVSTAGADGQPVAGLTERYDAGPDNPPEALPVALLVDHQTASGSEILSGALQHLDRGVVFGTNSFGKGTVQKIYPLADGIKFKLTVAEYRLADDVRVADVGIQPDVVFYPYRFDADGVWFPEAAAELRHIAPDALVLPIAEEQPGWRGAPDTGGDAALDAAVGLIASAEGASRTKVRAGLDLVGPGLRAAYDAQLQAVFAGRGIDWSARPPQAAAEARAEATLTARVDGAAVERVAAGARVTLTGALRNDGAPLWRARLRLHSVNGVWDDRVLPLGRVAAGAVAEGTSGVDVPASAAARSDTVEVWLEADGIEPVRVGQRVLTVAATPPAALAATIRSRTTRDGAMDVDVALTDLSGQDAATRVRFAWADLPGVRWVAPAEAVLEVPAHGTGHAALHFALGPDAPAALPLTLIARSDTGAELGRWPVALPRDGVRRIQAPTLALRPLTGVQPPGIALLQLRASDDTRVDHLLVYAGTERVDRTRYEPETVWDAQKVGWTDGAGGARRDARRLDATVAVPVHAGENRYEITATDADGLSTTQVVYILGQPGDAPAEAGLP